MKLFDVNVHAATAVEVAEAALATTTKKTIRFILKMLPVYTPVPIDRISRVHII